MPATFGRQWHVLAYWIQIVTGAQGHGYRQYFMTSVIIIDVIQDTLNKIPPLHPGQYLS